jgi:hypothetical protein
VRRARALAALMAIPLLAAPSFAASAPEVTLAIPDRPQAKESPASGWCGETAIQEALMHYGAWVPQKTIHDAGKPLHPDLYSPEMPVALAGLGVTFESYQTAKTSVPGGYAGYVRAAIDAGDPVIAGVKILPTEHPEWGLDHFVLAVGYGPKGLLVNTTWNEQQWVGDGVKKGISFERAFFALRVRGVAGPKGRASTPARATVSSEGDTLVQLVVSCPGMGKDGATLERREIATADAPAETWSLTTKSPTRSLALPRPKAAWFRCAAPAKG